MTTKKRELEIIYNLEWKNKPANGDEKSNMVGILDIPATTLDWKTFKSYLLKNSGATDDNVKVSYIDKEDREKPISSQLDFEIAVYTFRHKARMNEIITLKLDCVNSKKNSTNGVKSIAKGLSEVQDKMKPKVKKPEEAPEWFSTYMKKFKEELIEEISSICSSKAHQMNMYHARKLKADSYKRTRKTPLLLGDGNNDKELSKSAKMERKLESKLEKLEHKTMKIKAKKMALRGSSDSDVGRSSGRNDTSIYLFPNAGSDLLMNASVIKETKTPHMVGGEQFCKTWDVSNTGTLPWTKETELRYAWGSQALKPLNKEVPCPPLSPGEKGTICVFLEIPKLPGTYECYWHFYHNGRRFGHWLGCDIIVDEPPIKNVPFLPSPTYDVINIQDGYELVLPSSWTTSKKTEEAIPKPEDFVNPFENETGIFCQDPLFDKESNFNAPPVDLRPPNEYTGDDLVDAEILQQAGKVEMNTFSDSDNQSVMSLSDSSVNSGTSEDFVMLKMNSSTATFHNGFNDLAKMNVSSLEHVENLFTSLTVDDLTVDGTLAVDEDLKVDHVVPVKAEDVEPTRENATNTGQHTPIDLSNKSVGKEDGAVENKGYAYVYYKGRKIPISKKHLSAEYLFTAESVPDSEIKKLIDDFDIDEIMKNEIDQFAGNTTEQPRRTSTPSAEPKESPQQQDSNGTDECSHTVNFCCSAAATGNECGGGCGLNSSMTSSSNEHRFFVFPQFYPGYEVVPPVGAAYIDPNGTNPIPFQPVYRYNTVGEVLVNDWSTGLNYTAYGRCISPSKYFSSAGNSTGNTSRAFTSIPQSNSDIPSHQSPRDNCPCKQEEDNCCTPQKRRKTIDGVKTETFEDVCSHVCDGFPRCSSAENLQSNASSQTTNGGKPAGGLRGSNSKVPDLLSGATVVATSAINTARSVLNMFVPPRSTDCGRWQNGHWISTNPESRREKNLRSLYEMGFYNRDLNATLLARYNDDVNAVVSELLQ